MKPEAWRPGTLDAIATGSADGKRIVIKAVNYEGQPNTLIVRLQGATVPKTASVKAYTLAAALADAASLEHPDKIQPIETSLSFARDLVIDLQPYAVSVIEITSE